MSTVSLSKASRWMPLLVLLLSLLVIAPEAAAQSRERGRSGTVKRARVEQQDKKKAETRSRQPKASVKKERTRSRDVRTPHSRTETRARGNKTQSRSRDVRTPRNARKDAGARSRTETRTRQPQSRDRATAGRGATRGGRGTATRQDRARNDDFELGTGRAAGNEPDRQTRRPRRDRNDRDRRPQAERERRDGSVRAPRGSSASPPRRVDRQPDRRDDRYRRNDGSRRDDRYRRNDDRYRRNDGPRREVRTPRYQQRDAWRSRYERDHRYRHKHYKRRYHHKKHPYRPVIVRPYIHIDLAWPWEHRHHHGWRPRYVYKQVVFVEAGWGGRHRRRAQIDVRTQYYHELRHATRDRAEVDIYIEQIELYENGRYLGEVHHIPERLGRIRATVYRNGSVRFDREVSLLGDAYTGFEMISTRAYDGFVLDAYRTAHGLRVGAVDLRRQRVVPTSYSRLFDPYDFQGYVPVSLLPEDAGWLLDYGQGSFSGVYFEDDPYYYGGYSGYGDDYDDPYYGDDYYEEDYYEDDRGRPHYSVRSTVAEANFGVTALAKTYDRNYRTAFGADIHLKREAEFVRVK